MRKYLVSELFNIGQSDKNYLSDNNIPHLLLQFYYRSHVTSGSSDFKQTEVCEELHHHKGTHSTNVTEICNQQTYKYFIHFNLKSTKMLLHLR